MYILGISAYYHDSAAAILEDGRIIAAAQEERFTRKKHDAGFPENAIRYCLEEAGVELSMVGQIVFYDKTFLKFERLLETYYSYAPKGLASFVTAIPVWINEKLFLKRNLIRGLKKIGNLDLKHQKILFTEHHLSHAASAFYPSPFQKSVIVTLDGVGEWATASICLGDGAHIKIIKELHFPHSVGLLYSAFTYYLGFKVNSGEYKLMGLAPYGNPDSRQTNEYINYITSELVNLKDNGAIWLNQKYFSYATGLKMTINRKWRALFGLERRKEDSPILQEHCNLAFAIQKVTEEIILKMVRHAQSFAESKAQSQNICLAGGVALNCVANGKLLQSEFADNLYIQPAAGDAGGAVGAGLAAHYIYNNVAREDSLTDDMGAAFLGPAFSPKEIKKTILKYNATAHKHTHFDSLSKTTAKLISEGKVVGWFQGRMEFGPRALGNRSILGDARDPEMQKRINLKIKFRESFRPFASAVLAEDVNFWFDLDRSSPYMLLVAPVKEEIRKEIPPDYFDLPYMDRLQIQRSSLPAITHIDFSSRVQSVHKDTNPRFWNLINEFKKITGYGVIINTSFNVRGEPIVCTPEEAYICFMRTGMDYLVMEDFLFRKEEQPPWEERNWKNEMAED